MTTTSYETFEKHVQKTNQWLAEVQADLGWDDRHQAFRALRATLHALRDRLTLEETAQFGAQLPMIVRGFFYESWQPRRILDPAERHREAFFARIRRELGRGMGCGEEEIAEVVRAVFRLLDHRITAGEIEDVKAILPGELRDLWPAYAPASNVRGEELVSA